jgi:glycosyltransferase involved in cell wall biosynthesis
MKFSIILPSYLGHYEGAASDRKTKLIRAIESVIDQSYKDWELIIVADGCNETFDLVCDEYKQNEKIDCFLIRKQPLFSGRPRMFGIEKARGDYIIYLDSDDFYGVDHLKKIAQNIKGEDWVFYNDLLMDKTGKRHERKCFPKVKYQNGTANICHKRDLVVTWGSGYAKDDYQAVQSLLAYPNYKVIETPEYVVCHLPKRLDV